MFLLMLSLLKLTLFFNPVLDYLINRLYRVQLAAASFVVSRYSSMSSIFKLNWLPIRYNRDFSLSKMICIKAFYNEDWPSYWNYVNLPVT